MRGEFIAVWSETWEAIWRPLTEVEEVPADVYCDLYRELSKSFAEPPSVETLADIIDDYQQSRQALMDSRQARFASERSLVRFFEAAHDVLEDIQGDELTNRYFGLLSDFIDKYSLGYSLRRPCALSPTLPGMFADMANALKRMTSTDAHLAALYLAHDEAVRDLRFGATDERIKTCLSKQFMLLEAMASVTLGTPGQTLGKACSSLTTWPHATLKESLKQLYGFASNYPGIRHAGNPDSQLRGIETRDLAAVSIMLMGYSPYLTGALETNLADLLAPQGGH
jgi:hypothetical protein